MAFKQLSLAAMGLALASLWFLCGVASAQVPQDADRPVLRVVYFVPSDRKPEPDHLVRLDRILTEIQRFYREGMQQNGYGEMTFEIDRDANKTLRVDTIQGSEPMRERDR